MLLFLLSLFLIFPIPSLALTRSAFTTVSASITEPEITLNGYTSPLSHVRLEAPDIYAQTFSHADGYFEFTNLILPYYPSELCLSSIDTSARRTAPVCFPSPPLNNFHTDIGPIILPPTVTLDSAKIKPGTTAIASGQSLPNSAVSISFYRLSDAAPSFPKAVQAYSLPAYRTQSDSDGNFVFNLPTAYSSNYRLFATVKYQDSPSPKSNTLIYTMPSLLYLFWLENGFFITVIPLFVLTLTFFFYLIRQYYLQSPPRYLPAVRHSTLSLIIDN